MTTDSALLFNLRELLTTGRYSDLTISCSGKKFKVHRNILHCASPFFRKLLGGEFKEGKENAGVLELMDDDPEALQALIQHLYYFAWDDSFIRDNTTMSFAEKLQALAAKRFEAVCDPKNDLTDFNNAITLIEYCTNPNDTTLWQVIIPVIKTNIVYLLQHEESKALILGMEGLNVMLLRPLDGSKVSDVASLHEQPKDDEARHSSSEDEEETADRLYSTVRWSHTGAGRRLGE